MNVLTDTDHMPPRPSWGWLVLAIVAWIAAHASLIPFAATAIAALGIVLAFMMSVIALPLPEMVILRKVLEVPLIASFAGVVALGMLFVGYVFNAIL